MLFLAARDLSKGDAACEEYGMLHGFDNIAMGWEGLGYAVWGWVCVSGRMIVLLGLALVLENGPWVIEFRCCSS